jgi:tRNA(Ser,Leu) C12 N-acetylase TAN1
MARGFDALPFNAVAIAQPRASARALASLEPFGVFRATPYRRVLLGQVAGDAPSALVSAYASRPECFTHLFRLHPLEDVVAFQGDDVTEALCEALENAGPRVAGATFHVRARVRGLKGRVETQAVERALGAYLLDLARAAGTEARVRFSDPDLVLAIEVIGRRAGYGFLDRTVRAVPLVRPR